MSLVRSGVKLASATIDLFLSSPAGPRILIYHQVGAGLGRQMEVTVENFRRQLDWLVENRRVVSLEAAVASWDEADADRLVVLTFDDGYRDIYTTAFPMLKERILPFTLYVATEAVETGMALGPQAGADPLTWAMIEEMTGSGLVTIGAHTHTHRDLRNASEAVVEQELELSNELISTRLGTEPRLFAYPWVYWSPKADPLVGGSYRTAVLGGSPRPDPSPPPHRLHRYPVQLSDGLAFFRARITGGLLLEKKVRRRLRGYSGT